MFIQIFIFTKSGSNLKFKKLIKTGLVLHFADDVKALTAQSLLASGRLTRPTSAMNADDSPSRGKGHPGIALANAIKRPPASHPPDRRVATGTDLSSVGSALNSSTRKGWISCEPSSGTGVEDDGSAVTSVRDGLEQLCKSVDVDMPAIGVTPKSLGRAELANIDLDIGSVVEFDVDALTYYGVIRWIGCLTDWTVLIAGIELVCYHLTVRFVWCNFL